MQGAWRPEQANVHRSWTTMRVNKTIREYDALNVAEVPYTPQIWKNREIRSRIRNPLRDSTGFVGEKSTLQLCRPSRLDWRLYKSVESRARRQVLPRAWIDPPFTKQKPSEWTV